MAYREVALDPAPRRGTGDPVLDGPVRAEALPAIAAASAHGSEGPERRVHPARAGLRSPTATRTGAPGPATLNLLPPSGLNRRRFALLLVACATVLALLVAVVSGGDGGQEPYAAVSIDRAYLTAAVRACSATLGAGRAIPSISAPATTASDAARIGAGAGVLARLEDTLRALPATPAAAPQIARWLSDWSAYVDDERAYASDLASPEVGGASRPRATLDRADAVDAATGADAFAGANGLGACTIGAAGTPIESIP